MSEWPSSSLHDAQIGTMIEQMCRKGVPQHVRRQAGRIHPGLQRVALDQLARTPAGSSPIPAQSRIPRRSGVLRAAPAGRRPDSSAASRTLPHRAAPGAPCCPYRKRARTPMSRLQFVQLEADQFADTQAGGVERFEHRPITLTECRVEQGCGEQALDLDFGEHFRQPRGLRRHGDLQRRIAAAAGRCASWCR
jgi:hypothetical protein